MTFSAVVTRDERVLVSWDGRQVVALAGADARKVIDGLERATDEQARAAGAREGDRQLQTGERAMSGGNGDLVQLTAKDFKSDQEVRWCPGCGDYAILNAVQGFMPELGIPKERIVFVSGIGCAARFPYYMETYGVHSIHGRAPAIATGLATARPDLSVWVIGGDGDMLSIGGNHLIHALRRNVNLTILMLNNQIYGLTKGQYSPTSERGKVTKSTPMGSVDQPFNPLSVAIGAEATFVGRAIDTDKKELTEVLRAAAAHRGASFVEVLQNCNIYNDGAFDFVRENKENRLYLRAGEEVRWGDKRRAYRRGRLRRDRRRLCGRACSCTIPATSSRASPSRSPASPTAPSAPSRSASSATCSARSTTRRLPLRSASRRSSGAKATSRRCCTPETPGRSADVRGRVHARSPAFAPSPAMPGHRRRVRAGGGPPTGPPAASIR